MYCKFGNIRENFIFANSDKRHICDDKKLRLWHDLPIPVNDRVIARNSEDFFSRNFAKCPNLQYAAANIFRCIFAGALRVNLSKAE